MNEPRGIFVTTALVLLAITLGGCFASRPPALRVWVSNNEDTWLNGTASVDFVSSEELVNVDFPVSLAPEGIVYVYESRTLRGTGDLTISWHGADGRTASRTWTGWRAGIDPGYRAISAENGIFDFSSPVP